MLILLLIWWKTIQNLLNRSALIRFYEAVTLPYPSYIFALAMGTGKTVLIGTIIATEFAMALRYPEGEFMKKRPRLCPRHNHY